MRRKPEIDHGGGGRAGAFGLHQIAHSHNAQLYGVVFDPAGMDRARQMSKGSPA